MVRISEIQQFAEFLEISVPFATFTYFTEVLVNRKRPLYTPPPQFYITIVTNFS